MAKRGLCVLKTPPLVPVCHRSANISPTPGVRSRYIVDTVASRRCRCGSGAMPHPRPPKLALEEVEPLPGVVLSACHPLTRVEQLQGLGEDQRLTVPRSRVMRLCARASSPRGMGYRSRVRSILRSVRPICVAVGPRHYLTDAGPTGCRFPLASDRSRAAPGRRSRHQSEPERSAPLAGAPGATWPTTCSVRPCRGSHGAQVGRGRRRLLSGGAE